MSRPTKLNSVSLLVAVSSAHCVCETPLSGVQSSDWQLALKDSRGKFTREDSA
jgi:hypothetical protein